MPRRPASIGLVLLLLAACSNETPPTQAPYAAALDQTIADALARRELPGAAVIVVQGDQITYSRGHGMADLASDRPMTDSTPIVIGSTSKPITALAVLRLVQQNAVALDTPIVRYVPDIPFTDARAATITLRHLLTNRSGLPVGFSGPAYQRPSIVDDGALERLVRTMAAEPLLFAPGEGYAYSNRGWTLAGYVVQRVSGMSIEAFLSREVFAPLGMTATTLEFWTIPDLATGYHEGFRTRNHPGLPSVARDYGASGMVVSTARDMARLLFAMVNDGRTVEGKQFLTPELIRDALRAQFPAESELGGPTHYGLGWEVDSTFGALTIKKAGSVSTMVTFWALLPESKTAVGFAFNREDYGIIPLVGSVLSIVAGGAAVPVAEWSGTPPELPTPVRIAGAALDRWAGRYDTRFGYTSITRQGDSLVANYEGIDSRLIATSESTFVIDSDIVKHAGRTFTFSRRGAATIVSFDGDSVGIRMAQ
ncbi:MAG: serine hydrolase domain-containing protein [Gemmatimonadales bacterium]